VNAAGYEFEVSNLELDNDNDLVDTEGRSGVVDKVTVKEKMVNYIQIIQDFCDSLKYQVQFQDLQFLGTVEKDRASFIRLAQNCLSQERQHKSSRAASPTTWERATLNVMFY
jgi:hypothetical protein